ncbi:MAG: MmcB family DNA repair protein [Pseudomonadota bacterium]
MQNIFDNRHSSGNTEQVQSIDHKAQGSDINSLYGLNSQPAYPGSGLERSTNLTAAPGVNTKPATGVALKTSRPAATRALTQGVGALFADMGLAVLPEFRLPNGRRADVAGLNAKGRLVLAEIKSCQADFDTDQKWPIYLDYCDAFYFAVDQAFPRGRLPVEEGLIIADTFGAEIVRHAREKKLPAPRRKALTLRFARQAALRANFLTA